MKALFLWLALGSAAIAQETPTPLPNSIPAVPGVTEGSETNAMRDNAAACAEKMGFNKPHYLHKLPEVRAFQACKVKGP